VSCKNPKDDTEIKSKGDRPGRSRKAVSCEGEGSARKVLFEKPFLIDDQIGGEIGARKGQTEQEGWGGSNNYLMSAGPKGKCVPISPPTGGKEKGARTSRKLCESERIKRVLKKKHGSYGNEKTDQFGKLD